ncbi:MAG: glycosyltransferase family protein [Planctomycetota bacterium]|jgi:hypothetical protein
MKRSLRILVLGSFGGGGDWPPLIAAALALADAGHEILFFGDEELATVTAGTGLAIVPVPRGRDLATRIQKWQLEREENPAAPLPIFEWAEDVAPLALDLARSHTPDLLLCSDFTVLVGRRVREEVGAPICLVNATYYLGPGARRTLEQDFGAGSAAARGFAGLIHSGDLVLHATDAQFDPPPEPRDQTPVPLPGAWLDRCPPGWILEPRGQPGRKLPSEWKTRSHGLRAPEPRTS